MRLNSRVAVFMAFASAAGCAGPLEPEPGKTGRGALSGALKPDVGEGAHAPSFGVELKLTGAVVTLDPSLLPRVSPRVAFYVTGPKPAGAPLDTVPAPATLEKIRWTHTNTASAREAGRAGGAELIETDPATPGASGQNPDPVLAAGTHEIALDAPGRAGGGTVTVRFFVGFTPGTWWAGPDPTLWPASSDGDGRAVDVTDWSTFTTSPPWPPDGRGYFGPDSFRTIPSQRRPVGNDFSSRTFYEIYGNRIYARREGDSVHQDAWVVICNGGYDPDSPYTPIVDPTDPGLPPGYQGSPDLYSVLLPLGLVGSPIGFRFQPNIKLPGGAILRFAATSTYPNFDPLSVFRGPHVLGYFRAAFAGKAYLLARAQDSDGLLDPAIADPVALADLVDSGGGTPADQAARRKILTFNIAPAARPQLSQGAMPGGPPVASGR